MSIPLGDGGPTGTPPPASLPDEQAGIIDLDRLPRTDRRLAVRWPTDLYRLPGGGASGRDVVRRADPADRERFVALRELTADVLAEATLRRRRADPAAPGGGGPAGNARITAATGLVLLVLFLAELVTLLDVSGLIGWHVAIGVLLVPPALLKTATTGWRIVRYYGGQRAYRVSGPPPMLLRLLGPLVVLSTLGLLGSGLALIAVGPSGSRSTLFDALGQRVDAVTVHQAFFLFWAVVTGLHALARLGPAVGLAGRPAGVPGERRRLAALIMTLVIAVIAATLLLGTADAWRHAGHRHFKRPAAAVVQPPGAAAALHH